MQKDQKDFYKKRQNNNWKAQWRQHMSQLGVLQYGHTRIDVVYPLIRNLLYFCCDTCKIFILYHLQNSISCINYSNTNNINNMYTCQPSISIYITIIILLSLLYYIVISLFLAPSVYSAGQLHKAEKLRANCDRIEKQYTNKFRGKNISYKDKIIMLKELVDTYSILCSPRIVGVCINQRFYRLQHSLKVIAITGYVLFFRHLYGEIWLFIFLLLITSIIFYHIKFTKTKIEKKLRKLPLCTQDFLQNKYILQYIEEQLLGSDLNIKIIDIPKNEFEFAVQIYKILKPNVNSFMTTSFLLLDYSQLGIFAVATLNILIIYLFNNYRENLSDTVWYILWIISVLFIILLCWSFYYRQLYNDRINVERLYRGDITSYKQDKFFNINQRQQINIDISLQQLLSVFPKTIFHRTFYQQSRVDTNRRYNNKMRTLSNKTSTASVTTSAANNNNNTNTTNMLQEPSQKVVEMLKKYIFDEDIINMYTQVPFINYINNINNIYKDILRYTQLRCGLIKSIQQKQISKNINTNDSTLNLLTNMCIHEKKLNIYKNIIYDRNKQPLYFTPIKYHLLNNNSHTCLQSFSYNPKELSYNTIFYHQDVIKCVENIATLRLIVFHYPLHLVMDTNNKNSYSTNLRWQLTNISQDLYLDTINELSLDIIIDRIQNMITLLNTHCNCIWCDKFDSFNRGLGLTIELFSTPIEIIIPSTSLFPSSNHRKDKVHI